MYSYWGIDHGEARETVSKYALKFGSVVGTPGRRLGVGGGVVNAPKMKMPGHDFAKWGKSPKKGITRTPANHVIRDGKPRFNWGD